MERRGGRWERSEGAWAVACHGASNIGRLWWWLGLVIGGLPGLAGLAGWAGPSRPFGLFRCVDRCFFSFFFSYCSFVISVFPVCFVFLFFLLSVCFPFGFLLVFFLGFLFLFSFSVFSFCYLFLYFLFLCFLLCSGWSSWSGRSSRRGCRHGCRGTPRSWQVVGWSGACAIGLTRFSKPLILRHYGH